MPGSNEGGTSPNVGGLLEQEAALAKAKAKAIADLLDERVALTRNTAARLDAIASELKALGWHRTRAAQEAREESAKSAGK